jgi:hypothetical protein
MSPRPERYHWINTIVGILDQAYHLNDTEQVRVIEIVNGLLEGLNVPDRSDPVVIPAPLAHEVATGTYAAQLAAPRENGLIYTARTVEGNDIVVSIEAWCEALIDLLVTAYPDLSPVERFASAKILSDLLNAIGLPDRAASFFPDDVVRAAREIDSVA